jgi:hypothetical protein
MGEIDDDVKLEPEGPGTLVDEKGEVIAPDDDEESSGKVRRPGGDSHLDDEGDTDGAGDTPGSDGYDEREAIRAARREDRARRKQARRAAIQNKDRLVASLQMQVQDLSERLAKVDNRQAGTDFAKLDDELSRAVRTADEAKQFMKSTAEAGDWEGNADATELFYNARRRAEYLHGVKQRVTTQPQAPRVDNRVSKHASEWIARNKWYKHGSDDVDSVITKAVDDGLVREGYDPRTPEYWDELDDRLAEKLPHRFTGKKMNGNGRQGAPNVGGSGKNSAVSSGNAKEFFLSEARVKAMKEAGAWDDPEARKKMIARYREYDKQNPPKRS